MRLTVKFCHKKNCNRLTRPGFRFCMHPLCGKDEIGDEEE